MALTADADRSALVRIAVAPVWIALGLVVLPFLFDLAVPSTVRYLPFLASLLVFGLPHGAADHLAVARLGGRRPFVAVGALYLLAGGAYLLAWALAPAAAFAGFVLLTWFHWGQGDLYFLLAAGGDHLRTRVQRALALVVRGGIPMVVPLVGFPERYRAVAEATVGLFDPSVTAALAPAFRPQIRFAVGAGLGALSLTALALGYLRARESADWLLDALETALLWGYFLAVPPVLAVGLYFCLWHSVRHVVRLLAVEEVDTSVSRRPWAALARFGRDALPNTVGALVALGGLALAVPPRPTPGSWLGLYLVALAVLTLPHTAVVTWMDLREGVWSPN